MTRAILIVLDSFGIGGAPDADRFGDAGADTLGHIAEGCADGRGDRAGLRQGPLRLPHLAALGLGLAADAARGCPSSGLECPTAPRGQWGFAVETSEGKDTVSGHWEIAGVPVRDGWGYFPDIEPCFPAWLTDAIVAEAGLPGVLGNRHASGTGIIESLGEAHVRTGKPILYTSVDSVLQIAAHEEAFGLERLYRLCEITRKLVDRLNIGRVIARPFVGTTRANFERTPHRRDYAVPPPEPTLLDVATASGREVVSIGKIGDIFAHRGTGRIVKGGGNMTLVDATLAAIGGLADGGLIVTNLVDFDTLHGHRRDIPGYAAALEAFDRRVPELERALVPGDLMVLTADHGCDPAFRGTDHTRECVPVLAFGPGISGGAIGRRASFADIGQTVAAHLGLSKLGYGEAWAIKRA
ncbi:MAG: phosphopentomutase [Hyphomicrobiaceae bacterium]